jgi:hypothetical protein
MSANKSSPKKRRGRPRKVDPHHVVVTANLFRTQFSRAWPTLGEQLLAARSSQRVMGVLKKYGEMISGLKDLDFSTRVFEIIRDPLFPRVRSKSQIRFLADSLGADGLVKPRRSREICAKERKKVRHKIVRRDYYIECSCGYAGPALNGACQKCGTIELSEELRQREDYEY